MPDPNPYTVNGDQLDIIDSSDHRRDDEVYTSKSKIGWRDSDNPLQRMLSVFGINNMHVLRIVAVTLLAALIAFVTILQIADALDDTEAETKAAIKTAEAKGFERGRDVGFSEGFNEAQPPFLLAEPVEPADEFKLVDVYLGDSKFRQVTESMHTNLFCYNIGFGIASDDDTACSPEQHAKVLEKILTKEQLAFVDKYKLDTANAGWAFMPASGSNEGPSDNYDKELGQATIINP